MLPGLVFFGLWFLGMVGGYLLLRWLQKHFLGSGDTLGDRSMDYFRGFGDYNWQRWNERRPGEAEKRKPKYESSGLRYNFSKGDSHRGEAQADTSRLEDRAKDPEDAPSLKELLTRQQRSSEESQS